MSDATEADQRIADLESEVESLREQLELHQEVLSLLAAKADSDAIPTLACPYCGEGQLRSENGVTWQQLTCSTCEFTTYL